MKLCLAVALCALPAPASPIAYERDGWIWRMAADGTGQRGLVKGRDPAWSPVPRRTVERGGTWAQVKLDAR